MSQSHYTQHPADKTKSLDFEDSQPSVESVKNHPAVRDVFMKVSGMPGRWLANSSQVLGENMAVCLPGASRALPGTQEAPGWTVDGQPVPGIISRPSPCVRRNNFFLRAPRGCHVGAWQMPGEGKSRKHLKNFRNS